MEYFSAQEITSLVTRFSGKTLPKSEWTHQAHILVGIWHNMHYDYAEALDLVREKIKTYNLSVGTQNTEDAGYHETLTVFWMTITKAFLLNHPTLSLEEVCHQFLQSENASKTIPFEYYSREVLFSKEVRREWIDGDVKSITTIMEKHFELSDEVFENQFRNTTLSPTLFSHEAHLRLAWIHIKKYGVAQAKINIQNQIKDFVAHVGAEDKYNTTLTIAAIEAVNHFIQKSKSNTFKEFITEFPQLKNNFKGLINSHYSFDIFSSEKAKKEFLEPDLVGF